MTRIRTTVRTNICTIKQTFQPGLGEGPPGVPVRAVGSMVEIVRAVWKSPRMKRDMTTTMLHPH